MIVTGVPVETDLKKFCVDRDLPVDDGALELREFPRFIEERRKLLRARLKEALR